MSRFHLLKFNSYFYVNSERFQINPEKRSASTKAVQIILICLSFGYLLDCCIARELEAS